MYMVYGFIDGQWKCLNTAPVKRETAKFQMRFQARLRHCKTRIKKVA